MSCTIGYESQYRIRAMSVTRATICIFPYGEGSPGGLDGGAISTCPVGGVRLEHSEVHMARLRIA